MRLVRARARRAYFCTFLSCLNMLGSIAGPAGGRMWCLRHAATCLPTSLIANNCVCVCAPLSCGSRTHAYGRISVAQADCISFNRQPIYFVLPGIRQRLQNEHTSHIDSTSDLRPSHTHYTQNIICGGMHMRFRCRRRYRRGRRITRRYQAAFSFIFFLFCFHSTCFIHFLAAILCGPRLHTFIYYYTYSLYFIYMCVECNMRWCCCCHDMSCIIAYELHYEIDGNHAGRTLWRRSVRALILSCIVYIYIYDDVISGGAQDMPEPKNTYNKSKIICLIGFSGESFTRIWSADVICERKPHARTHTDRRAAIVMVHTNTHCLRLWWTLCLLFTVFLFG